MGGSALGRQARPLTTAQFKVFDRYCKDLLGPYFSEILTEYCPDDKEVHGDLDLLCAWEGVRLNYNIGGYDSGALSPTGELLEHKSDDIPPHNKSTNQGEPDKALMRQMTLQWVRAVGGREWRRWNCLICIAVPCRLVTGMTGIDSINNDADHHEVNDANAYPPFFQLDIDVVPPPALPLVFLELSYRSNIIILPRAIKLISPSLQLDPAKLCIRHSAYPGLAPIQVVLTHSAEEICQWLGLDWGRFKSRPFASEDELYTWFTEVKPGGAISRAWARVVGGDVMPKWGKKHANRKTEGWDFLVDWIHHSPTSPFNGKGDVELVLGKVNTSSVGHGDPIKTVSVDQPAVAILEPETPAPFDHLAKEALKTWGKSDEYEKLLRSKKEEAILLASRQKTRARVNA